MRRQFKFFDRVDIDGYLRRRHALFFQLRPARYFDVNRHVDRPFLDVGQIDVALISEGPTLMIVLRGPERRT